MKQLKAFLDKHKIEMLDDLIKCIQIPSISTTGSYEEEVHSCAQHLTQHLCQIGFENVQLLQKNGHPTVYADWLHAKGKPIVLIYGHYDVQPVDPLEEWHSHPFQPEIRDNYLYGRGATDNKGQLFMQLKALEALFRTNQTLPINVKLLIEGEEEIGSTTMPEILQDYSELLVADLIVISDTAMLEEQVPAICYGLRGILGFELSVQGPNRDLHSGSIYGGTVQNPIHAITQLLGSMRDETGFITIEGFYDHIVELSKEERKNFQSLPFSSEQLKADLHVSNLFGEEGFTPLERVWVRPTLEVNGISGGYQGEGIKTIIPAKATAKITCRIVPNQNPHDLKACIQKHIEANTPPGVNIEIYWGSHSNPYFISPDHPLILQAAQSLEYVFQKPVQFIRAGGSIPAVEMLHNQFQIPIILVGFSHSSANVHSANENLSLQRFEDGILALCHYYLQLGNDIGD
ncbi:dipeptidase [Brevibacillus laterosporus]|uniref:dipeptidase n=1 Tax=Brevibacillus laterosporus TaxID=1465 RepID=UPI0018F88E16|nr:dipeptidase [Brevibacillus laterosporus]